ncbi:MAG: hypothetical protein M3R49_06075 [Chloroflexota bacterium]|nr:hypothetical protein [Chloroflexota bacterium]
MRVWLAGRQVEGDAALVTDPQESVQLHFAVRPFFARLACLPARPDTPQIARAVNADRMLVRISLRPHRSYETALETGAVKTQRA